MTLSKEETELCKIFYKNGADKCLKILHSYSPAYNEIFKDHRQEIKSLLEIGVGSKAVMKGIVGDAYAPGASLRSWKEYFPNAEIFGIDYDSSVLFQEERISCFYGDQSSVESLNEAIKKIKNFTRDENFLFDVIIDDGSHVKNHMVLTYNFLKQFLKPGGLYIIEDIKRVDLNSFIEICDQNMKIEYIHRGINEWDDFVGYRRK